MKMLIFSHSKPLKPKPRPKPTPKSPKSKPFFLLAMMQNKLESVKKNI